MSPISSFSFLSLSLLAALALATSTIPSSFPAGLDLLQTRDALPLPDDTDLLDPRATANTSPPLYSTNPSQSSLSPKGASGPGSGPPATQGKGKSAAGTGTGTGTGTRTGTGTGGGTGSKNSASPFSLPVCGGGCESPNQLPPGVSMPVMPIPMLKIRGLYPDAEQGVLGIRNFELVARTGNCRPVTSQCG